jgi:hypothetical protein
MISNHQPYSSEHCQIRHRAAAGTTTNAIEDCERGLLGQIMLMFLSERPAPSAAIPGSFWFLIESPEVKGAYRQHAVSVERWRNGDPDRKTAWCCVVP